MLFDLSHRQIDSKRLTRCDLSGVKRISKPTICIDDIARDRAVVSDRIREDAFNLKALILTAPKLWISWMLSYVVITIRPLWQAHIKVIEEIRETTPTLNRYLKGVSCDCRRCVRGHDDLTTILI